MPTKKTDTTEEKKKPAKKTTTSQKKTSPVKKKATTTAEKKKVAPKKETKTFSSATPKKQSAPLSKSKQKKLRIEDKFSDQRYHLGVGKRKSAIALVRLHEKGKGEVFVNNVTLETYFFGTHIENALQPLLLTGKEKNYSITAKLLGGGISSQAEALRHGIARALVLSESELRPVLKKSRIFNPRCTRKRTKETRTQKST
jgi:small subunit ribosomal protein S9